MRKNESRIATTVMWLAIGTISSPFVVLICIAIGAYHGARFFLETATELAQIIYKIWTV